MPSPKSLALRGSCPRAPFLLGAPLLLAALYVSPVRAQYVQPYAAGGQVLPRPVAPCACGQTSVSNPGYAAPAATVPAYGSSYGAAYAPSRMDYDRSSTPSQPMPLGRTPQRTYEPPVLWQGLYAGLHAGYGSGSLDFSGPLQGSSSMSGGLGGLHLGHNWQSGSLIFGVETDLSMSWASGTGTATGSAVSANTGWLSSVRGRVGYSFGSLMAFGTAGLALARNDFSVGSTLGRDDILVGFAFGAGLEMKLAPQISGRIEAMHYGFGGKTMPTTSGPATFDVDQTVVRAGITYHFN